MLPPITVGCPSSPRSYADGAHKFWSGYFTSRPALKGMVRDASAVFGAARVLQSLAGVRAFGAVGALPQLQIFEEAMGVLQARRPRRRPNPGPA